ncbi:RNA methyltransferase [Ancylomarina salipaludis]|uniref:RNA methyltransferase n=1 Tax=Ancylomarina salipaludis TaxID=2501299 RepID=A0A4Q1JN38_9BACT|nr:RNA methyltransferase [Ancylomarina salipaludis]RXQ96078.1 RNA methyltransferase [Ancylomarina salipaludis]
MLSKNQIKLISSLQKKKFRDQHQLFIAEGYKLIVDLLKSELEPQYIIHNKQASTTDFLKLNKQIELIECDASELKKISNLKTPSDVLGIFKIPDSDYNKKTISQSLSLLLDDVQDPGNLGTIVRIADWFGIKHIFCSKNTVDLYNPKVIQATMGALARVQVIYTDLPQLINEYANPDFPVFGTFLEGETIYKSKLSTQGFIIMGNEGKGISDDLKTRVSHKLFIPNFPADQATSESLNVSVACSIVCSEFRRRQF